MTSGPAKPRSIRAIARLPLAAAGLALAACTSVTTPTASGPAQASPSNESPAPAASPAPYQRSFGPDFPPEPPSGELVTLDHGGALLSRDRRTLTLEFFGGLAYVRSDPCGEDYTAWAGLRGDVLEVAVLIVDHPDQATFAPGVDSCLAEAHHYMYEIHLPAPFMGSSVRALGTGELFVPPPERVAELGRIPAGWQLFLISSSLSPGAESHYLGRGYGPAPGAAGRRERELDLTQTFDGPPMRAIATTPLRIATVAGQQVPIGDNGGVGFVVAWMLGNDGLVLSSIDPDLDIDIDAFIEIANGVAIRPG